VNELKLIWSIVAFFLISQLLGIYGGMVILQDYTKNPYVDSMVVTSDTSNPMNAALFAGYIILGAVLMLLLIKIFKIYDIVFQLMEFFLIAVASSIVFYAIFRIFFGYELSMLLAIAAGLLLSALKHFAPWLKNAAAIAATGGVGIIFGISLAPVPAILFLIFLAIYDYVSVFITKHMVEFANFIVKKDLAFTVTAKGMVEGKERRIDLGTGDLIAPIILEVSVLSLSPVATVFVFIGALVSLAVFMYLVWERKVVLPALPPLVFGMLLFFLIGLLGGFY
jgi:presenilin-like A22 family membrane protease